MNAVPEKFLSYKHTSPGDFVVYPTVYQLRLLNSPKIPSLSRVASVYKETCIRVCPRSHHPVRSRPYARFAIKSPLHILHKMSIHGHVGNLRFASKWREGNRIKESPERDDVRIHEGNWSGQQMRFVTSRTTNNLLSRLPNRYSCLLRLRVGLLE